MMASRVDRVKKCQFCSLRTASMSFLLRHLSEVHSDKPGFNFCCGLNGCQRTYNINTYKHHVYSSHSSAQTNVPGSDSVGNVDGQRYQ